MNQILAESNDIFKYIIDSGDSKTPAAATLSTVLQKIDIHSLYVLFFCASSPFTSQHFDVINNFSARNEIWRFAPIWINGEITLLFPHQQKPLLHELIDAFNEIDHDLEYSIGVSRHLFLSEYPDFFQAFQEAKLATMINFYRKQEISTYFESMFMLDYNYVALIHSEKEITNAILSGYSEEKLYLAIDRYIDCFKEQSLLPQLVYESVYRLFNTLDRMLKFIDPICTINLENLTIHDFEQYGTIDKLHQALCDKLSFILKKGENYTQLNTHTLRDIKRYLDDHLDQSISLDRIEQQFYINKYVFCRQFKKLTGQTFGNYLKLQRLYKARDMLENSNMRIYEIAVHLGFKNESYFSSVFKKYFKYSPTEYRTAHCTPDSYGMS